MLTRRALLEAGGFWLAGLTLPGPTGAAAPVDIRMMSDTLGTAVWFDPIGVRIEPGQTVRFIVHANVHTTAAYHPRHDHHSLRIPEGAEPWDSRDASWWAGPPVRAGFRSTTSRGGPAPARGSPCHVRPGRRFRA